MPPRTAKPVRQAGARVGRRPTPPKDKHASRIPVYFTAEQKVIIQRAAAIDHDNVGNWVRRILLQAAEVRLGIRPQDTVGK